MRRATWLLLACALGMAQSTAPRDPVQGIVNLFGTYRIVMLGEIHECKQEYALLSKLIANPGFTARVNDIVVEFGNAKYQQLVDRYTAGENVPFEQVQNACRDTVGALGPVSPVYGEFYRAVREVNRKLPKQRRLRIVLGDPPIDWEQVRSREDVGLYLPFRDEFYAGAVRYEVLAKRHRALLIMGEGHFRRSGGRPGAIENELLMAFVKPYVILPGSDMVRGYDDVDSRFAGIAAPALLEMKGNWIGGLSAPGRGGAASTWDQTADGYLYLGPRDHITVVKNRRSDLDGTPYGRELQRRLAILFDKPPDFLPLDQGIEQPAFSRTPAPPPPLPALPKPRP